MRFLLSISVSCLLLGGRISAQETSSGAEQSDLTVVPGENGSSEADPAPSRVHATDSNYLLQPDDVIEVTVFREPDLTTDGMVRSDGCFDMKLIGAVKMANFSVDQATELIRAALAKDYLVNPRVSIGIVNYAKRKINILGEVREPGVYAFPPRGLLLLSDAVALAGGFLPTADMAHVVIRRSEKGRSLALEVDASSAAQGGTGNSFALQPDDAISVALLPKRHFTVLGQINRPGTYEFPDGQPLYLTDVLALAGGVTRLANSSRVLLKRTENGHEEVMDLDAKAMANSPDTQRVQVENDDTITVSESLF